MLRIPPSELPSTRRKRPNGRIHVQTCLPWHTFAEIRFIDNNFQIYWQNQYCDTLAHGFVPNLFASIFILLATGARSTTGSDACVHHALTVCSPILASKFPSLLSHNCYIHGHLAIEFNCFSLATFGANILPPPLQYQHCHPSMPSSSAVSLRHLLFISSQSFGASLQVNLHHEYLPQRRTWWQPSH